MFDTFAGLPLHAIVVHAAVVVVPLTAVAVLLAAAWPRFRRWAGVLPLVLAALSVVLVPVATQSGEALQGRVGENDLVERHAELGDGLLPWVLVLGVVALGTTWVWWRERQAVATPALPGGRLAVIGLAVAALVVSVGTVVQVVAVGHSGASAVWSGTVENTQPSSGDGDSDGD